jgi:hypothetical protein
MIRLGNIIGNSVATEVRRSFGPIVNPIIRKMADPWTPSNITREQRAAYKAKAIDYYERADDSNPNNAFCMLLGVSLRKDRLISSHIWKQETHGDGLHWFGLRADSLHNARNLLLLSDPIEKAFDVKQCCFLYDPINTRLVFRVLDPELRSQRVSLDPADLRTFNDIDNFMLQHPADKFPYRRILHWHAKRSFATAKLKGWIPTETDFDSYFEVSSNASQRDEDELENYFNDL